MAAKLTDLRDAKAMRAMGLPLNTEVMDGGDLPPAAEKAMMDGFKSAIAFRKRIEHWSGNPSVSTFGPVQRAFRRFLTKTVSTDPLGAVILQSEFGEIREQWTDVFERLESGEEVTFGPPLWPWEPTAASKARRRAGGIGP